VAGARMPIVEGAVGMVRLALQRLKDEDAVSAQFAATIGVFAKPIFERFRRIRHTAQCFDPSAAPITRQDAGWAIEKAAAALAGTRALLSATPPERFS
jgi:hypothetical protein